MINRDSESNLQAEINCTFTDIKLKNYSLNCRINEGMKGDFQTAISFLDDDILVIHNESYYESINEEVPKKVSVRYNTNKGCKGFECAIIPIVIASVVCIGALIAALIIIRKKKVKQSKQEESTNKTLNY